MEFVNAINVEDEKCETFSDNSPSAMVKHDSSGDDIVDDQDLTTIEEPAVKGLLGKGKSRIIFNLILKMDRAQILLMHENETKFATLSQDNLLTDIKVVLPFSVLFIFLFLRFKFCSLISFTFLLW